MKLINKIILVVCHLYITMVPGAENFLYLSIPTFLFFVLTSYSRILLIPHFRMIVCWLTRLTELVTSSLLFVLLVVQIVPSEHQSTGGGGNLRLGLLVAFLAVPGFVMTGSLVGQHRRSQIWDKLQDATL